MKKKELNLKTWLTQKLRRLSQQWPNKNEALKLARVSRGRYTCAHCKNIFGPKQINMDHVNPVVALSGFVDWDTYLTSLFCNIEGYQALCIDCHNKKTLAENIIRIEIKKT